MKLTETNISGLVVIEPKVFEDSRGFFFEPYNKLKFEKFFGEIDFVQDNESKSRKGVLRGFHFQKPPFDQAKLVRCIEGAVLDIALDLRKKSKTYGKYHKVILSGDNKKQFFIPRGFAHAFLVLSETALFSYKVDNIYAPKFDSGVIWNDPSLSIDWGFKESELIISEKDKNLNFISDINSPF
ncbi:dTDP-4-dehydrorhamnose 3,5-epimerase [Flavobacteriaceae bacterium]|nr:dTDP-4-dehydrorhamnose 3,5-epimerase [Flavobacteriaceae bacterium]